MGRGDSWTPWRPYGFVRRGVYWIDKVVHGKRHRISTGCRTESAALAEFQRWEMDPATYIPRGRASVTLAEAAKRFRAYSADVRQNSPRWVERQQAYLEEWEAEGLTVEVTAAEWKAYLARLSRGEVTGHKVGAASLNRRTATLKAFLGWAREAGLTRNRADEEARIIREDRDVNPPSNLPVKRWEAVFEHLAPKWRSACEVMLGAGLRYGEVARLQADDILGASLSVPRAKGGRGRVVPVSARTRAAARRLVRLGGVPDDEASQLNHRIDAAARKARVEPFNPHELRHTYATICLANGVPLRDLQARLGHASIRTTERYLHAAEPGKPRAPI